MELRLFFLLCLLASAATRAAVPEIPRFRVLDAADGLPSTTITALARDRKGFLWIATWDGLARFDGVGFRVWRHAADDTQSLPGNLVQALHVDARDRLWVATENGGLSMFDAERRVFTHYRLADHPQMGGDDVFAITSVGDTLWFGGFGSGLCRLDADGTISRIDPGASSADSLPSEHVLSLAPDGSGGLWVGTLAGLLRYDGASSLQRVELPGLDSPRIYSITVHDGRTWVGTSAGIWSRDAGGAWSAPAWSAMFARPNAVLSIVGAEDGEHWLGGQGGLWRTEGDEAPVPAAHNADGRDVGRVLQAILRQPDGGLWVGLPTQGLGYLRADWRRIAALSRAQGLAGGLYRGVAAARAGGAWLTSSTGAVEHLDTATGAVSRLRWHRDALANERLLSILEDDRGQLWIGRNDGLTRIQLDNGALRQWTTTGADPVPATGPVDWLAQTADGSLWLSSLGGGLQRRDPDSGRVLDHVDAGSEHGLQALDTESIQVGPDGELWLAGAQGLLRWNQQTRRFDAMIGEVGERVFSFAFQGTDQLWVHRLAGLESWRRHAGGWRADRRLTASAGIPAVESTGLQVDTRQRLWLATRRGLLRIDPGNDDVRTFGVRDGLLSQEFNDRALVLLDDGALVGSAADGSVVLVDTHMPDLPPQAPALVLDGVQVTRADQSLALPLRGGFKLQPQDHELQVSARLLSFDDPLGNRYQSRLEGFDRGWVQQGASGERAFSALPPGEYVLRMQGFDVLGNASNEHRIAFVVLPPWWRSGAGMAGFALLGLMVLIAFGALYRRRLRRRTAVKLARHKRELLDQASQAKTRFLATLGHEVRTPMTGVLGMSELLLSTPLDETQRGYTQAIQNAGSHLLRLVNDALDIARIEAGKLQLQQHVFELRALVAEVAGLTAPVARQRGIAFVETIDVAAPKHVLGDAMRVRQILLNLVGNAIKFTERGEVGLQVACDAGNSIAFKVSDSGPGISEEQQARLFQRFEQAEGARTAARYGGSGLGLAICQELAVAMGGHICARSEAGVGSCFTVTLPLPAAKPTAAASVDESSLRPLRILLVEDDPTVAEVISGLLRSRGHAVRHAPHGLTALTHVAAHEFDVALLDLDLPGLDGLALARQLRRGGFNAPLLAVTARVDAEAEPLARAAGFGGFLRKPVTGDMLAAAVASVMPPSAQVSQPGAAPREAE